MSNPTAVRGAPTLTGTRRRRELDVASDAVRLASLLCAWLCTIFAHGCQTCLAEPVLQNLPCALVLHAVFVQRVVYSSRLFTKALRQTTETSRTPKQLGSFSGVCHETWACTVLWSPFRQHGQVKTQLKDCLDFRWVRVLCKSRVVNAAVMSDGRLSVLCNTFSMGRGCNDAANN